MNNLSNYIIEKLRINDNIKLIDEEIVICEKDKGIMLDRILHFIGYENMVTKVTNTIKDWLTSYAPDKVTLHVNQKNANTIPKELRIWYNLEDNEKINKWDEYIKDKCKKLCEFGKDGIIFGNYEMLRISSENIPDIYIRIKNRKYGALG